jgi:hypothetical protein
VFEKLLHAIKKNAETLINVSKELGLEIKTEETKYMLLSSHQNAGQNPDIKVAKMLFGNAAGFKCLGNSSNK